MIQDLVKGLRTSLQNFGWPVQTVAKQTISESKSGGHGPNGPVSVKDIPEIVFSSGVCKDVMATAWHVDESFECQTMSPLFPLAID